MTNRLIHLLAEYNRWASRMDAGKATFDDMRFCAADFAMAIQRAGKEKRQ